MKKTLRPFLILSISIVSFLYPIKILNGCGGDWPYPEDDFHFLINQEIIPENGYEPFLLYYSYTYYPYSLDSSQKDEKRNLEEWSHYFNNSVSEKTIYEFVYSYDYQKLKNLLHHKETKQSGNKTEDLVSFFNKSKNREAIEYILFVRDIQPYVTAMNDWEGCAHDQSSTPGILKRGEELIKSASTEFIKLRLAYQIIRICHYTQQYEKCIEYYEKYIQNSKSTSMIRFMALGHKAGALKALGHMAEASYLYSLVIKNCPEKRKEAFKSIWFKGEYFSEALELCQNDKERITLHFLRALEELAPNVSALEPIYELDPGAEELDILVMRELKKEETKYTATDFYYNNSEKLNGELSHQELKKILLRGAEDGKIKSPALWYFLAGYIDFLNKNYEEASKLFNRSQLSKGINKQLKDEIRIVNSLLKISRANVINDQFENEILKEFYWLDQMGNSKDLKRNALNSFMKGKAYMFELLHQKYKVQGDKMKSYLTKINYSSFDLYDTDHSDLVDSCIQFIKVKSKTPLESYLGKSFNYQLEQLYQLKGMLCLQKGNFREAVNNLEKCQNLLDTFEVAPFEYEINNCFDCGFDSPIKYTTLQFAEELLKYEGLAKTQPEKAAYYYFLIGNGLFNTSYFGTSWRLLNNFRPYAFGGYSYDPMYREEFQNNEGIPSPEKLSDYYDKVRKSSRLYGYFNCSEAIKYYQKAIDLTKDKELAAKACYMAAKCEESNRYQGVVDIKKGLGMHKYYKILMDQYNDTDYYKEVIQECRYFNNYTVNPL